MLTKIIFFGTFAIYFGVLYSVINDMSNHFNNKKK